jgi:Na+-transporting NADH:ubiquinone oxidoreductase subunit C
VSKLNINSDKYILIFSVIMTVVMGALLSVVALSLSATQKAEKDFEQQKYILSSVLGSNVVTGMTKEEIVAKYNAQVSDLVIDEKGTLLPLKAKEVAVSKEYKKLNQDGSLKTGESMKLPVYMFKDESGKIVSYILPTFGFGLWDNIWGFIAVEADLNTVRGVVYDHKGETPGLGARITEDKVRARYVGKKIFDENQKAILAMQKGEGKDYAKENFKVDGMSGATLTANGLNSMIQRYFNIYQVYFKSLKS